MHPRSVGIRTPVDVNYPLSLNVYRVGKLEKGSNVIAVAVVVVALVISIHADTGQGRFSRLSVLIIL